MNNENVYVPISRELINDVKATPAFNILSKRQLLGLSAKKVIQFALLSSLPAQLQKGWLIPCDNRRSTLRKLLTNASPLKH